MRADWEREALAALEMATRERVITHDQMVTIVGDTLEPLIRADEYGKCAARLDDMDYFMVNTRAKVLADLRAQVLALPYVLTYGTAEVKRDDVLALLDGGGE